MTKERQREIFLQGKGLAPEDRNFIATPLNRNETSEVFEYHPAVDPSAEGMINRALGAIPKDDPSAFVFYPKENRF